MNNRSFLKDQGKLTPVQFLKGRVKKFIIIKKSIVPICQKIPAVRPGKNKEERKKGQGENVGF
jgi:hypothetical protein